MHLLCVSQGVRSIIYTIINPYNLCVGGSCFSYSQISILSVREVNFLAKGHRDNYWQIQYLNTLILPLKTLLVTITPPCCFHLKYAVPLQPSSNGATQVKPVSLLNEWDYFMNGLELGNSVFYKYLKISFWRML